MKNRSFLTRLCFALRGLRVAFKTESSFRIQSFFVLAAVIILAVLGAKPIWWAAFLILIVTILAAELFNTALEAVIDRLHPEVHPSIEKVKDVAAGAVLVLSLASIALFVLFLLDKYFSHQA